MYVAHKMFEPHRKHGRIKDGRKIRAWHELSGSPSAPLFRMRLLNKFDFCRGDRLWVTALGEESQDFEPVEGTRAAANR